jgi:hypothetical protein
MIKSAFCNSVSGSPVSISQAQVQNYHQLLGKIENRQPIYIEDVNFSSLDDFEHLLSNNVFQIPSASAYYDMNRSILNLNEQDKDKNLDFDVSDDEDEDEDENDDGDDGDEDEDDDDEDEDDYGDDDDDGKSFEGGENDEENGDDKDNESPKKDDETQQVEEKREAKTSTSTLGTSTTDFKSNLDLFNRALTPTSAMLNANVQGSTSRPSITSFPPASPVTITFSDNVKKSVETSQTKSFIDNLKASATSTTTAAVSASANASANTPTTSATRPKFDVDKFAQEHSKKFSDLDYNDNASDLLKFMCNKTIKSENRSELMNISCICTRELYRILISSEDTEQDKKTIHEISLIMLMIFHEKFDNIISGEILDKQTIFFICAIFIVRHFQKYIVSLFFSGEPKKIEESSQKIGRIERALENEIRQPQQQPFQSPPLSSATSRGRFVPSFPSMPLGYEPSGYPGYFDPYPPSAYSRSSHPAAAAVAARHGPPHGEEFMSPDSIAEGMPMDEDAGVAYGYTNPNNPSNLSTQGP